MRPDDMAAQMVQAALARVPELDPATLERLEVDLARLITTLAPDEGGARVPLGL